MKLKQFGINLNNEDELVVSFSVITGKNDWIKITATPAEWEQFAKLAALVAAASKAMNQSLKEQM